MMVLSIYSRPLLERSCLACFATPRTTIYEFKTCFKSKQHTSISMTIDFTSNDLLSWSMSALTEELLHSYCQSDLKEDIKYRK